MKRYFFNEIVIDTDLNFIFGLGTLNDEGFTNHNHDYSELVIIVSGIGIHNIEGNSYPVKSGDIFAIHKNQGHGFSHCENLEMYNIGYQSDLIHRSDFSMIPGVRILFEIEPNMRVSGESGSKFHATPVQMDKIRMKLKEMKYEYDN